MLTSSHVYVMITMDAIITIIIVSVTFGTSSGQLLKGLVPGISRTISPLTNNSLTYDVLQTGLSFEDCLVANDSYDERIGLVSTNESYYCDPKVARIIRGVFCCTPQTPDSLGVTYFWSQPGVGGEQEIRFDDIQMKHQFLDVQKVVFVTHGWLGTSAVSPFINLTRKGWLERGAHVVLVDWYPANQGSYWQSMANVRSVGAMIGYSMILWDIYQKSLFIGFSLGGQMIGEAGRFVRHNTNGHRIKECHALDPAGPFYEPMDYSVKDGLQLTKDDCHVVQVIHSSASYQPLTNVAEIAALHLGTIYKSGHCDFWVNCGHEQQLDCPSEINMVEAEKAFKIMLSTGDVDATQDFIASKTCGHVRSALIYAYSVNRKCRYTTFQCADCGSRNPQKQAKLPRDQCTISKNPSENKLPPDNECSPQQDVDHVIFTSPGGFFCSEQEQQPSEADVANTKLNVNIRNFERERNAVAKRVNFNEELYGLL